MCRRWWRAFACRPEPARRKLTDPDVHNETWPGHNPGHHPSLQHHK
tara:strand:- start:133829 stop:133966 length:138 start_codon:yes stop_codon:yes gene_type:complete